MSDPLETERARIQQRSRATSNRTRFRWLVAGLLLGSTIINYIDRQTLSVLAPYLKVEFKWSNSDFALIIVSFRLAYTIFQLIAGRIMDLLGTKRGLSLAVLWYSIAAMVSSLAVGLKSFAVCRFLLGAGEGGNWPGATKTVAEWFPKAERGLAVAMFDSGSAVGGAIAPALVVWLYAAFGTWRPAFVITGMLGLIWLTAWRLIYRSPEVRQEDEAPATTGNRWGALLSLPQTWGIVLGKGLTDPVWFFITDWFAIYLVSRGFKLENTLAGFWVPFIAADLGNFAGGGLSSFCIKRGWPVLKARKLVIALGAAGMMMLSCTIAVASFPVLIGLFAIATFAYAALSTMLLTLPADLYAPESVATVSGMSGAAAGIGTMISTFLIGRVTDRFSFAPIVIAASLVPVFATLLVFGLINKRNSPD
ncbi:MAG: MFS transporter [Acidobacteriaceae bacterium]|nr:MFS transporter [Acidobacteriaceae bacterium]